MPDDPGRKRPLDTKEHIALWQLDFIEQTTPSPRAIKMLTHIIDLCKPEGEADRVRDKAKAILTKWNEAKERDPDAP